MSCLLSHRLALRHFGSTRNTSTSSRRRNGWRCSKVVQLLDKERVVPVVVQLSSKEIVIDVPVVVQLLKRRNGQKCSGGSAASHAKREEKKEG